MLRSGRPKQLVMCQGNLCKRPLVSMEDTVIFRDRRLCKRCMKRIYGLKIKDGKITW